MSTDAKCEASLYPCVPTHWLWLPKPIRLVIGYTTMVIFCWTFLSPFFFAVLLFPPFWKAFPIVSIVLLSLLVLSYIIPMKESVWIRYWGQLWYELLDVSCNLSPEDIFSKQAYSVDHQLILAMHPHGIVPFHAIIWAAYNYQYLTDKARDISLYGFGAAADVVQSIPLIRNILSWYSTGSASYKTLKEGLMEGKAVFVPGRNPRHLFILPGGVAEIFTSTPKRHAIVFKNRRGLVKLSIETKAELVPCYVFGGTDFFNNLATNDGFFSRMSRKLRMGLTLFFGYGGLPLPFTPKVSIVVGKPIPIPDVPDDDEARSKTNDLLHAEFMKRIQELFERYKVAAGYPDAHLEIL